MNTAQQQYTEYTTDQIETSLRFARISLDSMERIVKLQLETAKSSLEEGAKIAKSAAGVKDMQDAIALRQKATESFVENTLSLSRSIYEITSQAQSELSLLAEERAISFNKGVVANMDKLVKSAPAGADVAVAAVKSTVQATAAAVDSMTKAAKQVADFADASVKAATTATADAVKTATRKSNGATASAA